jgi:hypothetical protein
MPRWGFAAACAAVAALVAGPTATAAAAPNPFYGVVGTYFPGQADLARVAGAGGGTFRTQIDWRYIEPTPGAPNFYNLDILVAEAAQLGVTLLPDLLGVPRWISRNSSRLPMRTAAQRQAWSGLLTEYARRYGTNGSLWAAHPELPKRPITTWEIWNEPNLGGSVGGKPSPRKYVKFLTLSSAALKAGDPAARVLSGGLFPYQQRNGITLTKYLNAMYKVPGAAASFDALGVHPFAAQPKGVLHWVRVTRRIMRKHGDGGKPIWVSAFGWVTGGVGFHFTPLRTTLRQQARKLTKAYRLLGRVAPRLGIASALWFTYTDGRYPSRPTLITDRMGLFTLKLRPKPSWAAFARAAGGTP